MTRGRLIAIAILLALTGGAYAYVKYVMRPPAKARALPQSGGERPYTKVVEGPGHDEHINGLEPVACRDCHIIEADEFKKPDEARCQDCHERVKATLHASPASREGDVCTGCHKFLSKRGQDANPWNCRRCHAQAQGELAAVVIHGREECSECHRPHGRPPTLAKNCVECHEHENKRTARHGARTGPQLCLDCHQPHGPGETAAARCVSCHVSPETATVAGSGLRSPEAAARIAAAAPAPDGGATAARDGGAPATTDGGAPTTADGGTTVAADSGPAAGAPRVPAGAIFRGGHDKCTGCHTNHDFRAAGAKSCRGCHGGRRVLAEDHVRAHGVCTSCHDKHNARSSAVGACGRCHSSVRPSHPQTEGGRCLGCHQIHPQASGGPVARACSGCHTQATSEIGNHAGGTRCTQCHRPHQFTGTSVAVCRNCHTNQATQTASNTGHQNCTRCHKAHRPSQPPAACPSCHTAQANTRPRGHRFDCMRCHDQHSGRQKAACLGCHQDRTQRLHGNIPGGCTNCHRAHGPGGRAAVPPCTTCHNRGGLPSLHSVDGHAQCRACHGGHSGPRTNRATCIACHEDKQTHEPQANLCSGCHTFGASR